MRIAEYSPATILPELEYLCQFDFTPFSTQSRLTILYVVLIGNLARLVHVLVVRPAVFNSTTLFIMCRVPPKPEPSDSAVVKLQIRVQASRMPVATIPSNKINTVLTYLPSNDTRVNGT